MEGTERDWVPHEEMGSVELAEQLGLMENRFSKRVPNDRVLSPSEIEVLANEMADDIEHHYVGNDILLKDAPSILKYHSDLNYLDDTKQNYQMIKFLVKTGDILEDRNRKRFGPDQAKAA